MSAQPISDLTLRPATRDDVSAILDIYNHAVIHTTASYDQEAVTLQQRLEWFDRRVKGQWPVVVAVAGGQVVGYGSYGTFRDKVGYSKTVEHSVYVAPGQQGKGVGTQILTWLINQARAEGYHVMLGSIDAENAGSLRFHAQQGFVEVARMPQVGYKFGRWLDMVFMQLTLNGEAAPIATVN